MDGGYEFDNIFQITILQNTSLLRLNFFFNFNLFIIIVSFESDLIIPTLHHYTFLVERFIFSFRARFRQLFLHWIQISYPGVSFLVSEFQIRLIQWIRSNNSMMSEQTHHGALTTGNSIDFQFSSQSMNIIPCVSQNTKIINFPANHCVFSRFGRFSSAALHSGEWWIHISSLAIYQLKKSCPIIGLNHRQVLVLAFCNTLIKLKSCNFLNNIESYVF